MKIRSIAIAMLLFAGSCFAADVDGKWSGNLTTPNGDVAVGFTFKADGTTLTGSTTGPDGADVKISDGKVDGNKISFSVTLDFGGMPLKLDYKGVIANGEIKISIDFAGMPMDFTVKKAA
jgi:hypothetical protein